MANEYATLAQFKALPNIVSTDATDDTLISTILTRASRACDAYCGGRRFYATTETRLFNMPGDLQLSFDDDLLSLTTLTNGDGAVIGSGSYRLFPANDAPYSYLRLRPSSGLVFQPGSGGDVEQVISVAGSWGYVDRTASDERSLRVISNTEQACLVVAEAYYKRRYGLGADGAAQITGAGVVITPKGIPVDAKLILDAYMRRF